MATVLDFNAVSVKRKEPSRGHKEDGAKKKEVGHRWYFCSCYILLYNNLKYSIIYDFLGSRYHHIQPLCIVPLLPSRGGRRKKRTQEEQVSRSSLAADSGQRDNDETLREVPV